MALHDAAERQDTLASASMPDVPTGLGVGWMVQATPFHASASVAPSRPPELLTESPTAVQAAAERHDTPDRLLTMAPAGSGVASVLQVPASHVSASVSQRSEL